MCLEDDPIQQELFKHQLKRNDLLKEYEIDLIIVATPKEAQAYLNKRKIDLVISDVKNDFASEDEVLRFLKNALQKSKLLFYTSAEYNTIPKLENVAYVKKLTGVNLFDKIRETLDSNKKQHVTNESLFRMTRPEYHVATPTDKLIVDLLDVLPPKDIKRHDVLMSLIEFNQLRKEIANIK